MGAADAGPGRGEVAVEFTYRHPREGPSVLRFEALDPQDHIHRVMQRLGSFYELDLLEYLDAMFARAGRPVVIDVGANIGNHSVFFGKYVASHVIAIEPNQELLAVLERNLRGNLRDPSSWSIVACALGATEGVGLVEVPEGAGRNLGMARIRPLPAGHERVGSVTVTTLDRVVATYYGRGRLEAPVGLIKVDVEGMELDVLRGAAATVARFGPDIVVEARTAPEKAAVDEILEPWGYVPVSRHCATPTYHYVRNPSAGRVLAARLHHLRLSLRSRLRGLHVRLGLAAGRRPGASR